MGIDPRTAPGHHHKQFVESSYSARYSEWDDDKAWSSQGWKADEMMVDRTETPVVCSGKDTRVSITFSLVNTNTSLKKKKFTPVV